MGVLDGLLGGAVAGAGSVASSWMNWMSQQQTNEQNLALTREEWGRQDNAVQRRAADMQAAGLNPVLAAGNPASTSPAARLQAPEISRNVGADIMSGAAVGQSIAQTQAQTDLTTQQARKAKNEADYLEQTLGGRVSGTNAAQDVIVRTVQDQVDQIHQEALRASWSAALAQVDTRVSAEMGGVDLFNKDGSYIEPSEFLRTLSNNRLAMSNKGVDLLTAQIAALAQTAQSSTMNADFLRRLGLPPMLVDIIMKAAGSAASAALR